jgi:hypothetical protein
MHIALTFDVEVWCKRWERLEDQFPKAFDRYIYGRSTWGNFALPETLEILSRNGLKGIFFVEPLFAARFGLEHLALVVAMIRGAGQDVQLHLHPEWVDEITPPILPIEHKKKPYLHQFTHLEQRTLIEKSVDMIVAAGAARPIAFRAGNFAANRDTFKALSDNGIYIDYSINECMPASVPDMRGNGSLGTPRRISNVLAVPMSFFRDGIGRQRHAQIGACSSDELVEAIESAAALGWKHFVFGSHNFEMLKHGSCAPDWIVYRRFKELCEYLASNRQTFTTKFAAELEPDVAAKVKSLPSTSFEATCRRYGEQLQRRLSRVSLWKSACATLATSSADQMMLLIDMLHRCLPVTA